MSLGSLTPRVTSTALTQAHPWQAGWEPQRRHLPNEPSKSATAGPVSEPPGPGVPENHSWVIRASREKAPLQEARRLAALTTAAV